MVIVVALFTAIDAKVISLPVLTAIVGVAAVLNSKLVGADKIMVLEKIFPEKFVAAVSRISICGKTLYAVGKEQVLKVKLGLVIVTCADVFKLKPKTKTRSKLKKAENFFFERLLVRE